MAFTLSTSVEKIFFQAPNSPQYSLTSHTNHLFWLPASEQSIGATHIPCMFYSLIQGANYLMIWCHGNDCDIVGIGMGLVPLNLKFSLLKKFNEHSVLSKWIEQLIVIINFNRSSMELIV